MAVTKDVLSKYQKMKHFEDLHERWIENQQEFKFQISLRNPNHESQKVDQHDSKVVQQPELGNLVHNLATSHFTYLVI